MVKRWSVEQKQASLPGRKTSSYFFLSCKLTCFCCTLLHLTTFTIRTKIAAYESFLEKSNAILFVCSGVLVPLVRRSEVSAITVTLIIMKIQWWILFRLLSVINFGPRIWFCYFYKFKTTCLTFASCSDNQTVPNL